MKEKKLYEKLAIALSVWFVLCLVMMGLQVFFFPGPGLALYLFFLPVGVIALLVYCIKYRKVLLKQVGVTASLVFCAAVIVLSGCTITNQKMFDLIRYQLYRSAYSQAAQTIAEQLKDTEDTFGRTTFPVEKEDDISRVIEKNGISYIKFGDNLLIDFEASASFSMESGFVYYEGSEILDYLEHPNQYTEPAGDGKLYEAYELMDEPGWAYFEWFW